MMGDLHAMPRLHVNVYCCLKGCDTPDIGALCPLQTMSCELDWEGLVTCIDERSGVACKREETERSGPYRQGQSDSTHRT
jgi:hypothetical protein